MTKFQLEPGYVAAFHMSPAFPTLGGRPYGAAALRALLPPSSVAPWEWAPERPLGGLAMEPFGARLCSGLPQEPSLPNPWGPVLFVPTLR